MITEGLTVFLGFFIFIFLGRKLGPGGYGLYSLVAVLILWIEWSITSIFDKAAIKLISETEDWNPIATAVVRLQLFVSIGAVFLVFLLAGPIAALFQEPALAGYIRLFSLDIPIYCLSQSHKNILDGIAWFRKRAFTTLVRWLAKLVLIFLLVQLGLSIKGAIIANIGASLFELALSRFWIRPVFLKSSGYPVRELLVSYGMPLFLQSLSLRLFGRIDLFALKALGGTAEQAGIYSAAQNLSIPVSLVGISLPVILLSTLSRTLVRGDLVLAKKLMVNAMRIVFWVLPVVSLIPWFASDLVRLVLGEKYILAAPLVSLLCFASLSSIMLSINLTILIASGKSYTTAIMTIPMVVFAVAGHLLLIPRLGPIGASYVTASVSTAGALCATVFVCRLWRILPPLKTILRSVCIAAIGSLAVAWWPAANTLVGLKFLAITAGCLGLFLVSGEFSANDLLLFRSMLSMRKRPETG
jgi:O-antigen/teichoic acid export membrane protein